METHIEGTMYGDSYRGYNVWRLINIFIISLSFLLRMTYISENVVEKIKTHILFYVKWFRKSCRLRDNVEKWCTAMKLKSTCS